MAKRHTEEEGKYNPLLFINSQIYSHEFSTEPGEGEYPISLLLLVLLVPRSIAGHGRERLRCIPLSPLLRFYVRFLR